MVSTSSLVSLALILFVSLSNAQDTFRPCACVEGCIYRFDGPQVLDVELPNAGQSAEQQNNGNPITSADGSDIYNGCNGDETEYLDDNLNWVSRIRDDNGDNRDIDLFFASSWDGFFTRNLQENQVNAYEDDVSGRLLRTEITCNNGQRGCVYFTLDADDFVCPCDLDVEAQCDSQQEIDGGTPLAVSSNGSGVGSINYNPSNRRLTWEIEVNNLSSDLVQLHFHGPAPPDATGPLQINATAVGNNGGRTGSRTLSEEQGRDLTTGLWYINVHTELNPSGELRGQII